MMNPPGVHTDFFGVVTKAVGRQKRQTLEGGVQLEDEPSELSILLADALLLALKTKHASIVDLLLERDARPEHLDIMELWRDARVTKIHHFNFHADFQPTTQRRTDQKVHVRKASVMQEAVRRTSLGGLGEGGGSEASRQAALSASAEIYYGKVVPLIQKQCRLPHSLTLWANQALHGAGGARVLDAYRWSAKDLCVRRAARCVLRGCSASPKRFPLPLCSCARHAAALTRAVAVLSLRWCAAVQVLLGGVQPAGGGQGPRAHTLEVHGAADTRGARREPHGRAARGALTARAGGVRGASQAL